MNLNLFESNSIPKLNYRDLMIFIVPLLIFGLYLFVYKPGVLTVASYSQLHQIAADKFTTAYPMFHTYLVMLCLKIFDSLTVIGLFQILIFAIMWMIICKYHRDDTAKSSDEFVVQFIITLIICLIPINAVYSITLSSNVLFSYALLFLCFLIKVMVDKDGQIDTKLCILMAVTLAFITGLNNYGIAIALISLISTLYYLFRKNTSENILIRLISITIVCILLIGSFSLIYEVKGSNYDEFTLNVNIPANDAFEDGIDLAGAKSQFFSSTNYKPTASYETATSSNIGSGSYSIVDSFVDFWRGSFLDGLFDNPILYLILSIILLAMIYVVTESHELFLIYVPIFANFIISIITGQNNMYSILLAFYLILIICVSLFFRLNLNVSDLSNITQGIPKPQTLRSQPREEMQENYADDDYYSYLESEIEELTMDDINEMLRETPNEQPQKTEQTPQQEPQSEQSPKTRQTPKDQPQKKTEPPQTQKEQPQHETRPQGDADDLLDEILKEIEMGKN